MCIYICRYIHIRIYRYWCQSHPSACAIKTILVSRPQKCHSQWKTIFIDSPFSGSVCGTSTSVPRFPLHGQCSLVSLARTRRLHSWCILGGSSGHGCHQRTQDPGGIARGHFLWWWTWWTSDCSDGPDRREASTGIENCARTGAKQRSVIYVWWVFCKRQEASCRDSPY